MLESLYERILDDAVNFQKRNGGAERDRTRCESIPTVDLLNAIYIHGPLRFPSCLLLSDLI